MYSVKRLLDHSLLMLGFVLLHLKRGLVWVLYWITFIPKYLFGVDYPGELVADRSNQCERLAWWRWVSRALYLGAYIVIALVCLYGKPIYACVALSIGYLGSVGIFLAWDRNERDRRSGNPAVADKARRRDLRYRAMITLVLFICLAALSFFTLQTSYHLFTTDGNDSSLLYWGAYTVDLALEEAADVRDLYGIQLTTITYASPWGKHVTFLVLLTLAYMVIDGSVRTVRLVGDWENKIDHAVQARSARERTVAIDAIVMEGARILTRLSRCIQDIAAGKVVPHDDRNTTKLILALATISAKSPGSEEAASAEATLCGLLRYFQRTDPTAASTGKIQVALCEAIGVLPQVSSKSFDVLEIAVQHPSSDVVAQPAIESIARLARKEPIDPDNYWRVIDQIKVVLTREENPLYPKTGVLALRKLRGLYRKRLKADRTAECDRWDQVNESLRAAKVTSHNLRFIKELETTRDLIAHSATEQHIRKYRDDLDTENCPELCRLLALAGTSDLREHGSHYLRKYLYCVEATSLARVKRVGARTLRKINLNPVDPQAPQLEQYRARVLSQLLTGEHGDAVLVEALQSLDSITRGNPLCHEMLRANNTPSILNDLINTSRYSRIRSVAVRLLARLSGETSVPQLFRLLSPPRDPSVQVRASVIAAADSLGHLELLKLGLRDKKPSIVRKSIEALYRLIRSGSAREWQFSEVQTIHQILNDETFWEDPKLGPVIQQRGQEVKAVVDAWIASHSPTAVE